MSEAADSLNWLIVRFVEQVPVEGLEENFQGLGRDVQVLGQLGHRLSHDHRERHLHLFGALDPVTVNS